METFEGLSSNHYLAEFVEERNLGSGGFGTVFQARNKLDGYQYAIKKISLSQVRDEKDLTRVMREIRTLSRLNHPNILRYHTAWIELTDPPEQELNALVPFSDITDLDDSSTSSVRRPNSAAHIDKSPTVHFDINEEDNALSDDSNYAIGLPNISEEMGTLSIEIPDRNHHCDACDSPNFGNFLTPKPSILDAEQSGESSTGDLARISERMRTASDHPIANEEWSSGSSDFNSLEVESPSAHLHHAMSFAAIRHLHEIDASSTNETSDTSQDVSAPPPPHTKQRHRAGEVPQQEPTAVIQEQLRIERYQKFQSMPRGSVPSSLGNLAQPPAPYGNRKVPLLKHFDFSAEPVQDGADSSNSDYSTGSEANLSPGGSAAQLKRRLSSPPVVPFRESAFIFDRQVSIRLNLPKDVPLTLYIQTELCVTTLKKVIRERNEFIRLRADEYRRQNEKRSSDWNDLCTASSDTPSQVGPFGLPCSSSNNIRFDFATAAAPPGGVRIRSLSSASSRDQSPADSIPAVVTFEAGISCESARETKPIGIATPRVSVTEEGTSVPPNTPLEPRVIPEPRFDSRIFSDLSDGTRRFSDDLDESLGESRDLVDQLTAQNRFILREVLLALDFLHSQPVAIYHRDVKPNNIFIRQESNGSMRVLLGDFGLSRYALSSVNEPAFGPRGETDALVPLTARPSSKLTGEIGTGLYASPEQLAGRPYDSKTDLFAFGLVMLELYYPMRTQAERIDTLRRARQAGAEGCGVDPGDAVGQRLPPAFVQNFPVEAAIVLQLLDPDPLHRPSASQLLRNSPVFRSREQHLSDENDELRREISLLRTDNARLTRDNATLNVFSRFGS